MLVEAHPYEARRGRESMGPWRSEGFPHVGGDSVDARRRERRRRRGRRHAALSVPWCSRCGRLRSASLIADTSSRSRATEERRASTWASAIGDHPDRGEGGDGSLAAGGVEHLDGGVVRPGQRTSGAAPCRGRGPARRWRRPPGPGTGWTGSKMNSVAFGLRVRFRYFCPSVVMEPFRTPPSSMRNHTLSALLSATCAIQAPHKG